MKIFVHLLVYLLGQEIVPHLYDVELYLVLYNYDSSLLASRIDDNRMFVISFPHVVLKSS
eukprot:UN02137